MLSVSQYSAVCVTDTENINITTHGEPFQEIQGMICVMWYRIETLLDY